MDFCGLYVWLYRYAQDDRDIFVLDFYVLDKSYKQKVYQVISLVLYETILSSFYSTSL